MEFELKNCDEIQFCFFCRLIPKMEGVPEILPAGTKISGYVIHEAIGSGAFSCVYKSSKENSTLPYALKIINKTSLSHAGDPERLQREIDTMAFLKHPNIVCLHDFFSDENNFYLFLDYCRGGDLAEYIASLPTPMREQQAANVFHQIVSAIKFIHQNGVAHRDLKPQNIMITMFPNVKVADFGLCGFIDDGKMKTFCGTPCYTAPECINQIQYNGVYSDIWSLGVILYEMVTGKHPWDVKNITKMVKQITNAQFTVPSTVTPACDDLIKKILRVKPNDRLTTEGILNHPWMKLASSKTKMAVGPSLPPLLRNSLGNFTKTIDRHSLNGDLGVASPFDGNGMEQLSSNNSSLPPNPTSSTPLRYCTRSSSTSFSKTLPKQRPISTRQILASHQNFSTSNLAKRNSLNSSSTFSTPEKTGPKRTPPLPSGNRNIPSPISHL